MVLGFGSILSAMTAIVFDRGPRDDDTVDRLNHMVMYALLVVLAVAAGTRQYVGTAIYCWSPAEFSEKYHRRYINHYCWVNAMYSIPFDEYVPSEEEDRYFNDVSFYKMATALFLGLALLFRLPQLIWKKLKRTSGVNLEDLVGLTTDTVLMNQDKRDDQLKQVADFFHRWVTSRQMPGRNTCIGYLQQILAYLTCSGNRSGQRLVYIYLFIKFLYLLNVIGQFFIVTAFLKINYWTFGFSAMTSYVKRGQWEDKHTFPRVGHCDFKIRQMANVNTYTVQCVLAINFFLEKMFLLLWFCLMVMMFVNAISLSKWMFQLLSETRTVKFMSKYFGGLVSGRSATHDERRKYLLMLRRYLKADGLFVIRLVAVNTTDMLTYDLVRQIWIRYKKAHDADKAVVTEDKVKMNGSFILPLYRKRDK